MVPPAVRAAMFSRVLDNDDVLARIKVPTLVIHGDADRIVRVSAANHTAATVPDAKLSCTTVSATPCNSMLRRGSAATWPSSSAPRVAISGSATWPGHSLASEAEVCVGKSRGDGNGHGHSLRLSGSSPSGKLLIPLEHTQRAMSDG